MLRETEYSNYNRLLEQAREAGASTAKTFIPKLCEQLKRENPEMPNEDVRDTVTNDCAGVWSKATIRKFMPDEYKDPQKQEAGKKVEKKQRLEEPIPAGMNPAESSSVSQTEQESTSFENMDRGPDVKPAAQTVNKLQNELKNVREVLESEIENKNKRIKELLEGQDLKDIPELVDNKIGPVKIQNLSKINEYDRRGYQILASRFGETV